MDPSIDIPSSGASIQLADSDLNLRQSLSLLSLCSHLLSEKKISLLTPQKHSELDSNIIEVLEFRDDNINSMKRLMFCQICTIKQIAIGLSCGHWFCLGCIEAHIKNSTMNKIILNINEIAEKNIISSKCPVCSIPLTLPDVKKIFNDTEKYEKAAIQRKINEDIEASGRFFCVSCNKHRGKNLFLKDSCMHMCKICAAKQLTKGVFSCETCKEPIKYDPLRIEQEKCSICSRNKYLVGDYLQELCSGYLYCTACVIKAIDQKYCFCHKRIIDYDTKVSILSYIMQMCDICQNENYRFSIVKYSCCSLLVCYNCIKDSDNCQGCGSGLAEAFKGKIRKILEIKVS